MQLEGKVSVMLLITYCVLDHVQGGTLMSDFIEVYFLHCWLYGACVFCLKYRKFFTKVAKRGPECVVVKY